MLASASPRRSELLKVIGVAFRVFRSEVDESRRSSESPRAYVRRLAETKAQVAAIRFPTRSILAADTAVVIDRKILHKPGESLTNGKALLNRLSGRTHEVITGVCFLHHGQKHTMVARTRVTFRKLARGEVDAYVRGREGIDKAGGYAIQGRAGAFVERIMGSPSNVVGLPLSQTLTLLTEAGYLDAPRSP